MLLNQRFHSFIHLDTYRHYFWSHRGHKTINLRLILVTNFQSILVLFIVLFVCF